LATLRKQAASGGYRRRVCVWLQRMSRAAAVFLARKVGAHLGAYAMHLPRLFPAFGGNDAQSTKLLANQGVIAFGVELGIGQHAAEGSEGMGLRDQSGQVGAIVPRSLT
jgi:hypothetical protein